MGSRSIYALRIDSLGSLGIIKLPEPLGEFPR